MSAFGGDDGAARRESVRWAAATTSPHGVPLTSAEGSIEREFIALSLRAADLETQVRQRDAEIVRLHRLRTDGYIHRLAYDLAEFADRLDQWPAEILSGDCKLSATLEFTGMPPSQSDDDDTFQISVRAAGPGSAAVALGLRYDDVIDRIFPLTVPRSVDSFIEDVRAAIIQLVTEYYTVNGLVLAEGNLLGVLVTALDGWEIIYDE